MKLARRSVLAAAALALAGCDLTLPWSSSDPGERLEVSPTRLEFVVNKGDPVPAAKEVRIRVKTSQARSIGLAVTGYEGMLDLSGLAGAGRDWVLPVRLSTTWLANGAAAKISIAALTDDGQPLAIQEVTVTCVVHELLDVSPPSLTFFANALQPPPPDMGIQLNGAGLAWQASANRSWIQLRSTSGTAPSYLVVGVDHGGLAPGTHSGEITLTPQEGAVRTIPIHVQVAAASFGVSPGSLDFQAAEGLAPPADQDVQIFGGGLAWQATSDASWLVVRRASGTAPSSLSIGVDHAGLGAGPHTGHVTLTAPYASAVVVTVTLAVDVPAFVVWPRELDLTVRYGWPVFPDSIPVHVDGGYGVAFAWTATPSVPWLTVAPASGTTPTTASVVVDPKGTLPFGTHSGFVTFTSTSPGAPRTVLTAVHLTLVAPTLTATPSSLAAHAGAGEQAPATDVTLRLDAGGALPFTVTSDVPWLSATPSSGAVNDAGALLRVRFNRGALPAGTHQGKLTVRAATDHDTVTAEIPVTLTLEGLPPEAEPRRLVASEGGVAFASTPGPSLLARTLSVTDTGGDAIAWTATADAAWLSVTPSGSTPGALVVTADPSGLAADAVHEATVTLSAATPGVAPEQVRVGLWVGSAAPATSIALPLDLRVLAVDPVRPYAYLHARGDALTVLNLHTGEVVATVPGVGTALGAMAVSTDGARLWVADGPAGALVPVALPALVKGTPVPDPYASLTTLRAIRTRGRERLLLGSGDVLDVVSGVRTEAAFFGAFSPLAASRDGRRMAVLSNYTSSADFHAYSIETNPLDVTRVLTAQVAYGHAGDNGTSVALSPDGVRMYTACGAPYVFGVYGLSESGATALTPLPASPYPGAVDVAWDGRVAGTAATSSSSTDLWIYPGDGTTVPLATHVLGEGSAEVRAQQLAFSGDGLRIIGLTDAPAVRIVTAP